MTKYQLYKLISKNRSLKDERHPMFEKNRFMKFLGVFMWLYYAAILLFLGVVMASGMKGSFHGVAAFHILDGGFIYLLIVDFWTRFILQETPAQEARPYALLPVRRSFLMNVYLFKSGFSLGNLFWGFMLIPFGLIAVYPLMGWSGVTGWWLGWWLLCISNGFIYLFCRTLISRSLLWTLLPAAIHGGIVALMLVPDVNFLDMPCTKFLYGFALWNLLPILIMIAIIAFLYFINYQLQMRMVYNEVAKKEEVELKSSTQMNFLNRYGALGEYLKLEMKMRLRNKNVRQQFFVGMGCILMLSGLMYFTDVYSGTFMTSFICLYDYIVLGMMTLISIMSHEGNYMDGLMSRRESILTLLKAKYYINSVTLLIPILIVLPLMISGKISPWMNVGYFFFTIGVLYPIMFQMAVYNRETLPLNTKITGKQGNMTQQIMSLTILFLPIGVEKLATVVLGDPWGFIVLIILGIIGLLTHNLWLQNIYNRFMQRRYVNMEGFRASRNS